MKQNCMKTVFFPQTAWHHFVDQFELYLLHSIWWPS